MSSDKIPLYTQTSYDWHNNNQQNNKPYSVNSNVGINEYIFGRTTPNNKFIVASGLVLNKNPWGIEMVGGKEKKIKFKLNKNNYKKNLSNIIMTEGGKKENSKKSSSIKKEATRGRSIERTSIKEGGKRENSKKLSSSKEGGKREKSRGRSSSKERGKKDDKKKKKSTKSSKDKKKKMKGGLFTSFNTSEFGMNPGVGTQMAVDTTEPNPLLKQMKSNELNNIYSMMDETSNVKPSNYYGGEKKMKKKIIKKDDMKKTVKKTTKKIIKKTDMKKTIKKSDKKKTTVKKDDNKKTTVKNFFKKLME